MKTTDTTAPDYDEATETDQEWRDARRRERYQELMSNLEVLTDLVADAGPLGGIGGGCATLQLNVGCFDGTMTEQIDQLHAIASSLGAPVEERLSSKSGSVHYTVNAKPAEGLELHVFAIASASGLNSDEIAEAKAAHAAHLAERVTISYEIEHDEATAAELWAAFARHGVDAVTDIAHLDHGHPTVTVNEDRVFVDLGAVGGGLPALAQCVSVEAYAVAIAAYARGDFDSAPCPARPGIAFRAIRSDGDVLTAYACEPYHEDLDGELTEEGYTVVRLSADTLIPKAATCGHRAAIRAGGAR